MNEIKISTEFIKLDQLLKFAGISFNGSDAKNMIKDGIVKVNGNKEFQRGKKIYPEDKIEVDFEDEIIEIKVV